MLTSSYAQQNGVLSMTTGTSLTSTTGDMTLQRLIIEVVPGSGPAVLSSAGRFSLAELTLTGSLDQASGSVFTIQAASMDVPTTSTLIQDGLVYTVDLRKEQNGPDGAWNITLSPDDVHFSGPSPELAGAGVANSLLSSASNLQTLSIGTLENLKTASLREIGRSSFWVEGLGGFSFQRSEGMTEGYDYQGGGYALGGDIRLARDWSLGASFGQMIGKNIGRDHPSTNRQNTVMGMVGAQWQRAVDSRNSLSVIGAIGYGSTQNEMKTSYSNGKASRGDWANRGFLGILKGTWNVQLPNDYTLSPEIGLEYADILQSAFAETGDMERRFDKGHYRNLSLPIGVTLHKKSVFDSGKIWRNAVSVAYVPDVYRKNAETTATRAGRSWSVSGAQPARNAVRAGVTSSLSVTPACEIYCSYRVEARSNTVEQTCGAGLRYAF